MGKKIKRIKLISFILSIVELVAITVFISLYFTGVIKGAIDVRVVVAVCFGFVVLDVIYVWIVFLIIASLRQQTDLRAAEVIGSDIQEAYNFAQLGLVVTDQNNIVLWTNDLFKERHLEIIDTNIIDWQPNLASLKDNIYRNDIVKLVINGRNYEVKYLAEAGLWIFKDTTDFEAIFRYNKEQAPVLGILTVDNYQELVRGDEDYNDVVAKLKNVIFAYAKDFDILLRRIKDDTYSMICNYESFLKMKEDNFSILDKARDASSGEMVPMTLSIGIAHNFPDYSKLNELANAALDIAMSRGGDQVVVSTYGADMEFYGGKSEAQERRNKVKTRVLADSLIQLINNSSNVLVMGHKQMDMDALGACLGIKAICLRLNKDCKIITEFKQTEAKTRSALHMSFTKDELIDLTVTPNNSYDLINPDTLLVVVDVHIPNMTMESNILDKTDKIVVIDHHRRAEEYIDSPVFNHIDSTASSTCEIITEFIRFATLNPRITIPPTFATIMLSGIFLDSSFYKSKSTGMRTFEASSVLKEFGADNSLADDFLKDDFEEHTVVNHLIEKIKTPFYGVVYALGDPDMIYDPSTLAKAANRCLEMKGIHTVFIIGRTSNKESRISCRSDGSTNVQYLAEKLGGGGHFTSAAVVVAKSDLQEIEQMLLDILHSSLNEAKADAKNRLEEGDE